jgi:hypothetical protein
MDGDPDSRVIGIILFLTSFPIVVITYVSNRTFGGGATMCLAMSIFGVATLVSDHHDSTELPRARIRPRKR